VSGINPARLAAARFDIAGLLSGALPARAND
jgi:hypothetical protein